MTTHSTSEPTALESPILLAGSPPEPATLRRKSVRIPRRLPKTHGSEHRLGAVPVPATGVPVILAPPRPYAGPLWLIALGSRLREPLLRSLGFLLALVGLILTFPLMVVIALAIRLTSPGPVIFRQRRIGLNRRRDDVIRAPVVERRSEDLGGKPFTMYKFRSMEHRPSDGETWAAPHDPRTTRLGAFLRRHHLDELPQMVNVLLGQMCIVGPRPEQPELFRRICAEVPEFASRQRVPPGITGLAQVTLPYARSIDDARQKLRLDLDYIDRRSLSEDVHIMWRTALKLTRRSVTADSPPPPAAEKAYIRRDRRMA